MWRQMKCNRFHLDAITTEEKLKYNIVLGNWRGDYEVIIFHLNFR